MKTLRIFIAGTVQGISFRQFIYDNAVKLNLRGYVRNLEDGRVEIVIEGRDERVNEMIGICQKGAPHTEIRNVEIKELRHQGFDGFKILKV